MQTEISAPQTVQIDSLVLEQIPSGELAWLRPASQLADDEPRYVVTDAGRRALAMAAVFDPIRRFGCTCSASGTGGTCSFVASSSDELERHYRDSHDWSVSLCAACGKSQDGPSCATREHWGVA